MSVLRRSLIKALPLVGLSAPALAQNKERLVVTAYGGLWTESVRKNFIPCFEQKTHMPVDIQAGESADWLTRIRANREHPPIDIVTLAEVDSLRAAREGLLDVATPEKVPNLNQIPGRFREPWGNHAVVQNFGALGVIYNKEAIPTPPRDWAEMLEAIAAGRFGRKVSLPAGSYTWGPEFLWLLSQQYDGDINQVFTKLQAARRNVLKFWNTPVEALNLFATRQVNLMVYWDGRSYDFIGKGNAWANFYIPAPTTIAGSVLVAKVKNAPDIAWEYMNCCLSQQAQLGHASTILYGVTNQNVVYPENIRDKVTSADRVTIPPYDRILDQIPAWLERWNKDMR